VTSDTHADLLHLLGMPVSAWSSRPISVLQTTPPSLTVGRLIWSQLVSRRLHITNETVGICAQ
jgi:hypothetical protein